MGKAILFCLVFVLLVSTVLSACFLPRISCSPKPKDEGGDIVESEGLQFALNEDGEGYTVVGVGSCKKETRIVVPSMCEGKPVVSFKAGIFDDAKDLEELVLSDGMKFIPDSGVSLHPVRC